MNETDNEGDDVLLASLSAITEERDQALTLLARTSASLFRLLGPAENSAKMLSTLRMLVELLGAGGGSRSAAAAAGPPQSSDDSLQPPCTLKPKRKAEVVR